MSGTPDFDPGFSTAVLRDVWASDERLRRMVQAEVALAGALADAGVISDDAAAATRRAAGQITCDAASLFSAGWERGTPVLPLVDALREAVGAEHARAVHLGATSQDILDTALMLQIKASLREIERLLDRLSVRLQEWIERDGRVPVMARTLLRPAQPFPFAVRAARWLDPLLTHMETATSLTATLPAQLGGPVGDLAAYGAASEAVTRVFARILGLAVPRLAWHTDRTPVVQAVNVANAVAGAAAAIASDLAHLSQPEIGEIRLRGGASSSMAHKENPIDCVRALAASRACHGLSTIVTAAAPHELERAAGSWQAEWFAVPLVMQTAAATLEATLATVASAALDAERARQNLGTAATTISAGSEDLVQRVLARATARTGVPPGARASGAVTLSWEETGTRGGPPIVFLHALGTDRTLWADQVDRLSNRFRVVTLDLRGHGQSPVPSGPYGLEELSADVILALDAARVDRAHVVGLSLGGVIALRLAIAHPARVKSVVAANTAARIGSEQLWRDRLAAVDRDGLGSLRDAALARWFTPNFAATDPARLRAIGRVFTATSAVGYAGCCAALATADLRADVPAIETPALVIGGSLDVATPVSDAVWLHEQIRGSRLEILEAAHLSNVEQRDAFTDALSRFLGDR